MRTDLFCLVVIGVVLYVVTSVAMQQKFADGSFVTVAGLNLEQPPSSLGNKLYELISERLKSDIKKLNLTITEYNLLAKLQISKGVIYLHKDWFCIFKNLPVRFRKQLRSKVVVIRKDIDSLLKDLKNNRDPRSFAYYNLKQMVEMHKENESPEGIIYGDVYELDEKIMSESDRDDDLSCLEEGVD